MRDDLEVLVENEKQKIVIDIINDNVVKEGINDCDIPSVKLYRASKESEVQHSIYEPSLIFVAQGAKIVMLGNQRCIYEQMSYLITSIHLPIAGQIVRASEELPFLSIVINFSANQIFEILKELKVDLGSKNRVELGLSIGKTSPKLFDAIFRLVSLLNDRAEIPVLSPIIIKEILFRLLQSEHNSMLRQFAIGGTNANKIAKTISVAIPKAIKASGGETTIAF